MYGTWENARDIASVLLEHGIGNRNVLVGVRGQWTRKSLQIWRYLTLGRKSKNVDQLKIWDEYDRLMILSFCRFSFSFLGLTTTHLPRFIIQLVEWSDCKVSLWAVYQTELFIAILKRFCMNTSIFALLAIHASVRRHLQVRCVCVYINKYICVVVFRLVWFFCT